MLWKCEICHREYNIPDGIPFFHKCSLKKARKPREIDTQTISEFTPSFPSAKPSLLKKILNFGRSIKEFVWNGMPLCDEQQANERLTICQSNKCGLFVNGGDDGESYCSHNSCGCPLNPSRTKLINKLYYATEKCPVGLWGPVEPVKEEPPDEKT